ncbi:MAG: SpoIIE family protein phosphatase [Oligoflexia bacterium]|nr:SpoIIE family protein phosphatase [Oligoflexia bacterium]
MIKILVVDDEPDVKSLFLQKFRRKIHEKEWAFEFCYNGEEALKMLDEQDDIDLVLSDINMPKMDGLTLLEEIKSTNPNIKAIIISAYGDMQNIRTAMNRGAFDFITKPIDFEDVEMTLNKTIQYTKVLKQALEDQNKLFSLNKELEVARKIQKSILPPPLSPSSKCSLFAQMIPAKAVGGDYYDFFLVDDHRMGFVIADVSGKGISSALFAVVNQTLLKSVAPYASSPKKCLQSVNTVCSKNNDNCMFATVFYGILDLTRGHVVYTNAGHNPPYKVTPSGKVQALSTTNDIPVGVDGETKFDEKTIQLKPGEFLVLYTDGVTEANNREKEEFGEKRLMEVLSQSANRPIQKVGESLLKSVKKFAEETQQYDDITCVLLKYED